MPWRLGKHTTTETPAIIAGPFLPEPAVNVLRRWDRTTIDQVEIKIGNIPVDIDLITFYHFIDKLAEGKCSRIRFMISYGYRHLAFATISAKTASETARRINGNKISGLSKLLRRTLTCHLAV